MPSRIDGTARWVRLYWLDALRNHVLTDASSAKPGYRSSFSEPSARMSVAAGNSSSTMTTTGARSVGTVTSPDVAGRSTGHQLRRRAEEEERAEEEQVGHGQVRHEQPGAARSEHEHGHSGADEQRQHRTRTIWSSPNVRSRASPNAVAKTVDDGGEHDRAERALTNVASTVAPMPTSGGTSAISSANHTIWAAAVVAGDEELRVLSEQVEQRLGHRQTAQTQDDECARAQLCCHHLGHRAASYRRPGLRGCHHHLAFRPVQLDTT